MPAEDTSSFATGWPEPAAGIELAQLRVFHRRDVVVVEQHATWKLPDASASTRVIGTVFRLAAAVVASVIRYDSLDQALAATGLLADDEVP